MNAIGDYIDQNPTISIIVATYLIFGGWLLLEFINAPFCDDDDF
jgi:hypothetical protein